MGVRREVYLVTGVKMDEKFTSMIFSDEEKYDELNYSKKRNPDGLIIVDGMSGQYTFFGKFNQLSDGYDDWDQEIIEFNSPNSHDVEFVKTEFKKHFPNETMPEVKNYYLPHYT